MNKEVRRKLCGKEYREKNREKINQRKREYSRRPEVKVNRKEYDKKNRVKILKKRRERNKRPEIKLKKKEYDKENYKNNKSKKKEYGIKNKYRIKDYHKEYYQRLEVKIKRKEYREKIREIENKRRKKLGLPLVGEGWTSEGELLNYITNLFPNYEITFHNRSWSTTKLELDIYIPELKLAFEYNGLQHYEWIEFFHPNILEFEYMKYNDRIKKKLCKMLGITLIRIKYNENLSEQLVLTKLKHFKLPIVQKKLQRK